MSGAQLAEGNAQERAEVYKRMEVRTDQRAVRPFVGVDCCWLVFPQNGFSYHSRLPLLGFSSRFEPYKYAMNHA